MTAETVLRLALVPAAVWLASLAARRWGHSVSGYLGGILLSLPVTGSIMPRFTLAGYGPGAVARLARGFVVGLSGFTTFFLVVTLAVVPGVSRVRSSWRSLARC